ncbi:hypothetical protein D3C79_578780 [compost metagenome]
MALAHLFAHGGAVGTEGAPLPLGDEQRLLRIAQQLVAVAAVVGAEGDAEGRGHIEVLIGQHEGAGEAADHLLGEHFGLAAVDDAGHQEGELVAADAGHQILGAHPAHQPIRHLSQQGIADVVIHAVVDRLEVVEIQHHEREALAPLAEATEAAAKQPAVRQAGEVVVVRLGRDLLLRQLGLGEIAEDGDVLADPPPLAQGADHQLLRIEFAVLALVPHFTTPDPYALEGVIHVGVEGLIVQPGLEHAGALAAGLLLAVAGDLLERRVHRDDAAVGVAHQDRLGEVVIDPVGELELFRMALDGVDILQHHHEVVGMHLLVADQGHRHPAPQHGAIPVQVALLLGKGGALSPLEPIVERDAGQPVVGVVELGDGELLQLLLAVTQHLFDGRIDPEDPAVQVELADTDRRMGHHGVQEVGIFRLGW